MPEPILRGALSGPAGVPQPATYWNPNGAPRVMSRELEEVLRQLGLQAARGEGGALDAMNRWQRAPMGGLMMPPAQPLLGALSGLGR